MVNYKESLRKNESTHKIVRKILHKTELLFGTDEYVEVERMLFNYLMQLDDDNMIDISDKLKVIELFYDEIYLNDYACEDDMVKRPCEILENYVKQLLIRPKQSLVDYVSEVYDVNVIGLTDYVIIGVIK